MKKIAIVTYFRDNFGSILQAYSTIKFLEENGYEAVLINRNNKISKIRKLKNLFLNVFRSVRYKGYLDKKIKQKKERKFVLNTLSSKTKLLMNKFVEEEFKIVNFENRDLNAIEKDYEKCIVGSDQVWNISSYFDDYYFLNFIEKEKKIALSPSFGTRTIPKYYLKSLKNSINSFPRLSVREETGVELVRKLTGREAIRLPDPTIILDKHEWNTFSIDGLKRENYILLHFLGVPSDIAIKTINNYLHMNDCDAYCIVNNYIEFDKLERYCFIDINPVDYVSLINNANFVFTDSFHSTLFSINMQTDFITFERQLKHGQSQSSRITDLLTRYSLNERFFDKEKSVKNLPSIDNRVLNEERQKIRNHLLSELSRK